MRHVVFAILVVVATAGVMAQVPNIILGRPTATSITASVLCEKHTTLSIIYGVTTDPSDRTTSSYDCAAGVPEEVVVTDLEPNTTYYYRLRYRSDGSSTFSETPVYRFHTQRAPGTTFRFLLEADEHLYDKKGIRSMYQRTLQNEALDSADLLISLGDIFGDDHTPTETTSADMDALHKDYRQYLGAVCHSMPFFVCLGNHEGESGYYLKQDPPNNIAVYGTIWRKYYYPNPSPDAFYSGNTVAELFDMGLPENYYAFTWGDALFVVLDVYRHCDVNDKPQNWDWTLGEAQYKWLQQTLTTSTAKYKFVFAHHTRGQGRGGTSTATGFEWGGYDKGTYMFDKKRPGWDLPIHQLMVQNGVNIFFQGHDHLYAKEELDGMVYQEVPMPSDSTYQIGMIANADAYTDVKLDGTGHLRVTVAPQGVTVDYVRAYLPADTMDGSHKNREVAYTYTVGRTAGIAENVSDGDLLVAPNPATSFITFTGPLADAVEHVQLVDMMGRIAADVSERSLNISAVPNGIYMLRMTVHGCLQQRRIAICH